LIDELATERPVLTTEPPVIPAELDASRAILLQLAFAQYRDRGPGAALRARGRDDSVIRAAPHDPWVHHHYKHLMDCWSGPQMSLSHRATLLLPALRHGGLDMTASRSMLFSVLDA
jgi:hypothetical protein